MYISAVMANLQKCSRCKSTIDISFFGMNRKKEPYKTCDNCRSKNKTTKPVSSDDSVSTTTSEHSEKPVDEKHIIVLDVETNGLIGQFGATPNSRNLFIFPRIVQFSWGLYTESGEQVAIKDFIIEPDGWTMNGTERIHGITQERAFREGVDIKDVLAKFKHDIDNNCLKLVCHNVDFDKSVVASEFIRANIPITDVETYCTMKQTADFCKLYPKKRGQYKWPKLEELYMKCFNENLENAHNSYYDVVNCAKCYFAIQGHAS